MNIHDLIWRGYQVAKRIGDFEASYLARVQGENAEQQARVRSLGQDDDVPYDDRPTSEEVWAATKVGWTAYREKLGELKQARGI